MKKKMQKFLFTALVAMFGIVLTGCNPELDTTIFARVENIGPEYVDIYVNGGKTMQLAYRLYAEEDAPATAPDGRLLFNRGVLVAAKPGATFRIAGAPLKPNAGFRLYVAIKIDGGNYYEECFSFRTAGYQETGELLTVVSKDYHSYMMRISVPAAAKEKGHAIRFNQCDVMMYNYMRPERDDYSSLLYNSGNYTLRDTTIRYSEEDNWYDTGMDSDGDGKNDLDTYYNPISPGEPIVYVAGEFEWMEEPADMDPEDNHVVRGFTYPAGWEPGYYLPCLDSAKYWPKVLRKDPVDEDAVSLQSADFGFITDIDMSSEFDECWEGAHKRVIFKLSEPEKLDAKVNVKLVDVSPIDATIHLVPDEGVDMYAFGMFDEAMYKNIVELCEGRDDYLQWAITSYFAAYTFGTKVAEGPVEAKLTNFYYQTAITEDTNYYVLVTAMGDSMGSKQSFTTYTFRTTEKTMEAPEIEVTAVDTLKHPYSAKFNIKCTSYADNPLVEAYYAADYVCNWTLNINSGKTYFTLTEGNNAFSAEELKKINSEEGLDIDIHTVDGQTTRCVVVGYNEEYTPNDLQYQNITDCPAVADYEAPYATPSPMVDTDWYLDLADEWTATATLRSAKDSTLFEHKSKITLLKDLYDYPEELPEDVISLYTAPKKNGKPGMSRDSVNALWQEFKMLAKEFTEERLENHNRLLGLGWMDKDSYHRLSARTPYDLFKATDYSSVDVMSLYFDFGPKWFLETKEVDGKPQYTIPMDSRLLPPGANWSVPFYLTGMELEKYQAVQYGSGWTPRFPVTVSEDRDTITIHPLEHLIDTVTHKTVLLYPQMMGIDYGMGQTLLENPVVSEIVLTRGWTEPEDTPTVKSRFSSAANISAKVNFPKPVVRKARTGFPKPVEFKTMEMNLVSDGQFKERADELVEKYLNRNK